MMQNRLLNWVMLWSLLLSLGGCVGVVEIWGVNRPLSSDDDDDDDVPDIDFSSYSGAEFLNIRWNPEQADAGYFDCQEEYAATGSEVDAGDQCPSCDVVWSVTLEVLDPDEHCLGQGTTLDVPPSYERFIGMDFHQQGEFSFFRSTPDSGNGLVERGEGAFDGTDFTWSGVGDREQDFSANGFTLYFSGEGGF